MHIVMFSMTPLFREKSMGGAQKQLKKVALYLAEKGHHVTILCTRRQDAAEPFQWHERLQVKPIYRFKQPFPEPYATDVYHIANAIADTAAHLQDADVFYNHDGGLIFPYIYDDIPAIISLRSIIFSETLQSGFLFQGDGLIVPSAHTARCWGATVGRFFPALEDRLHVIHNGLDFDVYQPDAPNPRLAQRLGVDPDQHFVMLYPHRPEPPKGIQRSIAIVDRLVNEYGMQQVRVLVPQWIDRGLSDGVSSFYAGLEADIARRGLSEHFVFHDWISDTEMPDYFRLGDVTLAVGNYVETFGNTPYESLACGTPAVAARVGPYREMLADAPGVTLVDYDDDETAADAIRDIAQHNKRAADDAQDWLHAHFDQRDMVAAYADIILNAQKGGHMPYQPQPVTDATPLKLAPWCYRRDKRIFHDFQGGWASMPALCNALDSSEPITASSASGQAWQWYREGYLVPA